MCRSVFEDVIAKLKENYEEEGEHHFKGWVKVTWESDKAWALFKGPSS